MKIAYASALPVRIRLTLWYMALLACALLLFAASVYALMSQSLLANLDSSLRTRANQIVPSVTRIHGRLRLSSSAEEADAPYIPEALLSAAGGVVTGFPPKPLALWLGQHHGLFPRDFSASTVGDLRVATVPVEGVSGPAGFVMVWQPLRTVDDARRSLLLLLLAAGPGLLVLSGIGGILIARRALRPVSDLTRTAGSISVTDLHRRVPVGSARDELTELALTFNGMIARLEAAVDRERRFTADASHELRSPLAVILAEASLALEESLEQEDYQRAMEVIHEQAAGMKEMISELLTLARVETIRDHREVVQLRDIVDRAVRDCAAVAQERGVTIVGHVDPIIAVEANGSLLTRAIHNLLDNAVKASPHGGTVRFVAHTTGTKTVLTVHDDGPGIAPEDQERIFEPFFQAEKARTPGDSHGLGLTICRRIVNAHGGEVTVQPEQGRGSTFTVVLPMGTHDAARVGTRGAIAPPTQIR